jgi:aryl-alcohol dehydrogenase-like predicted oxidoreductase
MRTLTLGRTGLVVSRLALGCMSYGDPNWRPWVLDEAAARPFFRRAIELGINFFDTADMYSLGRSEEVTGKLLREFGQRDELVIASKVFFPMGSTPEAPNMGGLSRKHIVQGCEASLKRLGLDTIDLYQLHRLDHGTPFEETLAALDHLVQSGKVRYLGASSMFAWQLMKSLSVSERHGWARYVCMQDHYNLLYREEEREMLPLCLAEGLGVIPWSPLARGRLARAVDVPTARDESDDYTRKLYDQPGDAEVVAANRAVAAARGVSPAVTALAWLLSRPAVTAPIIGATKPEHLDTAVQALDVTLSEAEVAAMEAPYRPHPVRGHG